MTATDAGTVPGTVAVPAAAEARRRRGRRATQRSLGGSIVLWVLLGLGAVFILLPLVWMLSTAFKQPQDAFAVPPHWLSKPTGSNFSDLLTGEFRKYVLNSLLVSVVTTVIALAFGIPAGYAFARTRIRGGKFIQAWFVLAYVIPPVIFIIPLYIIYQHVHLLDSYTGLVLAYETGILPFTVWLMRAYMSEVPKELDEAAWIDGCSKLGALWRVVLPTVLPGITTVGLMVGLSAWGEYFGAVILTGPKTQTAPVAVNSYVGLLSSDWSKLAAAGVVVIVPALLATVFVQRGFARGLSFGAVKQ
jgi:multiple sugar transport system permease protein